MMCLKKGLPYWPIWLTIARHLIFEALYLLCLLMGIQMDWNQLYFHPASGSPVMFVFARVIPLILITKPFYVSERMKSYCEIIWFMASMYHTIYCYHKIYFSIWVSIVIFNPRVQLYLFLEHLCKPISGISQEVKVVYLYLVVYLCH